MLDCDYRQAGADSGFRKGGFLKESGGLKSLIRVQGQSPGKRYGGQVPEKLVILCKLCYTKMF